MPDFNPVFSLNPYLKSQQIAQSISHIAHGVSHDQKMTIFFAPALPFVIAKRYILSRRRNCRRNALLNLLSPKPAHQHSQEESCEERTSSGLMLMPV